MTYKESQYGHQTEVLHRHPEFFSFDKGGGRYRGKEYGFILRDGMNNLYEPIREDVLRYFRENRISWWGGWRPTGHMLSSQIACLNHLFSIREDPDAVLSVINGLRPGLRFDKVLPLMNDKDPQFVTFEAVSSLDHMNEGVPTRGANCTSVDALIAARTAAGETWLIPIEWKYTEAYAREDKSEEDRSGEPKGSNGKGLVRLGRYSGLIGSSAYLKKYPDYHHSPYFFEPFYQLMRQTIWAEQMILHRDEEWIRADRFLHLHVIPEENGNLLRKKYHFSGKGMEESWRGLLLQDIYQIASPETLLSPLKREGKYSGVLDYLKERYW